MLSFAVVLCLSAAPPVLDAGPEPPGIVSMKSPSRITSLVWTADNNRVLLAGQDGNLRVWNPGTGKVEVIEGHKKAVRAVAVSKDGNLFASAGDDGLIHLWDLPKRKKLVTIDGPQNSVRSLAFAPDGKMLAWVAGEAQIHRCAVPSGKVLPAYSSDKNTILMSVCFSPVGKQLLVGGHWRNKGRIYQSAFHEVDAATGKQGWGSYTLLNQEEANKDSGDRPATVSYSADGSVWVGLTGDGQVSRRSANTNFRTVPYALTALVMTLEGKMVLGGTRDGTLRFVKETAPVLVRPGVYQETGEIGDVAILRDQGHVIGLALSPNGKRLAWVNDAAVVRAGSVSRMHKEYAVK